MTHDERNHLAAILMFLRLDRDQSSPVFMQEMRDMCIEVVEELLDSAMRKPTKRLNQRKIEQ